MVKKCSLVDKAILAGSDKYLPHILKENPDIIALGYDQKAYVRELKNDLKKILNGAGKRIKIIRLKPYKEHIYKNSLLNKKNI